ncbi:hypothetical protein ES677_15070 [Bizionia gelidisalsuginis]|uniref:Uncharacterized protein n=1 Tax=Bizionia gelidisalsuginis TaxID=291188 RepID=A0ABY3M6R4_9FLAO|nr:hypothetical protein [Bizionia gelidisalsuginis]TYC07387.1 hypothetical protein ES677_15070 [Bizionia gelidisalsuginis]
MNDIKLNKYEINFLTEPFPIHLGDVKNLFISDFGFSEIDAISESIDLLKRMYELNFIQFEILLYYKSDSKIKIVLDEPEKGFELKIDSDFWIKLKNEKEIWNRLMLGMNRNWDFGIDLSNDFYEKYYEPDDTEFYKLINQE